MKTSEDKKHKDIQTKINQLKSTSEYTRKILLTLVGITLTSLLIIIPVSSGQVGISILELDEKINIIHYLKILLISVYITQVASYSLRKMT